MPPPLSIQSQRLPLFASLTIIIIGQGGSENEARKEGRQAQKLKRGDKLEAKRMEGWDLEAVVRGCCIPNSSTSPLIDTPLQDPFSFISPPCHQLQNQFLLPHCDKEDIDQQRVLNAFVIQATSSSSTSSMQQELEDLCKPFFSSLQAQQQQQPPPAAPPRHASSRSKRRKNQQKRIVCQVPAEGLSSDMWAWRKYGQKPIKGSPYPRGYYRCSSSKGCLARKQVERSRSDPNTFVITYTAEHNHPIPTHRNSLAGSTRHKPSTTTTVPAQQAAAPTAAFVGGDGEPISKAVTSSPLTLTTTSIEEEDDVQQQQQKQQECREREEDLMDMLLMEEDDMFFDLGDLPTTPFDDFAFPSSWLSNNAATAAGGS